MIWESSNWEEPLLDMAARLEELMIAENISEAQRVQIEKDIFIGFYSIRKLIEAKTKLTDKASKKEITMHWYPNIKKANCMNWHHIGILYDFSRVNQETRKIRFVSNLIIHSYVFTIYENENGGLAGIFFNSEKYKNEKLYELNIDDIIDIFNQVGRDYPTSSTNILDPETGEYIIYHDEEAFKVNRLRKLYRLTSMAIATHIKQDDYLEEIQEQLVVAMEKESPRIRKYCDFLLAYAKGKKAEEMKNDIDDSDWKIFEKARKNYK